MFSIFLIDLSRWRLRSLICLLKLLVGKLHYNKLFKGFFSIFNTKQTNCICAYLLITRNWRSSCKIITNRNVYPQLIAALFFCRVLRFTIHYYQYFHIFANSLKYKIVSIHLIVFNFYFKNNLFLKVHRYFLQDSHNKTRNKQLPILQMLW